MQFHNSVTNKYMDVIVKTVKLIALNYNISIN